MIGNVKARNDYEKSMFFLVAHKKIRKKIIKKQM